MKILVIMAMALSLNVMAEEDSKHMVSFGNDFNVGWNGSSTKADISSGSGTDDFNIIKGNLGLNYAYRLFRQFQLGAALYSNSDTTELDRANDTSSKVDKKTGALYIFGIFNFSEDFTESFYVMAGFGRENVEQTAKDDIGPVSSKTEYDISGYIFRIGKRLNLKFMGIQNLTYSPSLTFKYGDVGGDLKDDQGVDSFTTVQFDLIKFDLLF